MYLGLRRFSLRAFAGNFDFDELEWALAYAHDLGRRVYVAVNIQPFDHDFDELEKALGVRINKKKIKSIGVNPRQRSVPKMIIEMGKKQRGV